MSEHFRLRQQANCADHIDREYRATEFPFMREFMIQEAERERDCQADRIAPFARALGGVNG